MSKTDKRRKTRSKSKPHSNVAAFLLKTYEILEDPAYHDIACWNEEGDAFIVKNVTEFSDKILPKYFKHNNFASFVRQLNMYDFHKTRHENNENEFRHALFKRGHKHLLGEIKRKTTENQAFEQTQLVPVTRELDFEKFKREASHFSTELKNLKNRQTDLEKIAKTIFAQNTKLLKENKLLWTELMKNKEKYERKIEKMMMLVFSLMQYPNKNNAIESTHANNNMLGNTDFSEFSNIIGSDQLKVNLGDKDDDIIVPRLNDKKDHEKFFKQLANYFQTKGNKTNLDRILELAKKANLSEMLSNKNENAEPTELDDNFDLALDLNPNVATQQVKTRGRGRAKSRKNPPNDLGFDDDLIKDTPTKFVKMEAPENQPTNLLPLSNTNNMIGLESFEEQNNVDQPFNFENLSEIDPMKSREPSSYHQSAVMPYNYQQPAHYTFLENNKLRQESEPLLDISKRSSEPIMNMPQEDPMSLLTFPKPNQSNFFIKEDPDDQENFGFDTKSDLLDEGNELYSPYPPLINNNEGFNFGQSTDDNFGGS